MLLASAPVLQPGRSRSLQRPCQLNRSSDTPGTDALRQIAAAFLLAEVNWFPPTCSGNLPAPFLAEVSSEGGMVCANPQGHHGTKRHPKLCASYRSQKALRLLNSTVASQEPHEHHDGSDRDQDIDSCKGERRGNALL